jgi:5-methylcytosine-specific restriction enzyme subunit McrC
MDVHLLEGGDPVVRRLDDAAGEALTVSGAVIATRAGGGQWELAPSTKVGVVTVGEATIWIHPKIDIARILFLLGYARTPGWSDDVAAMAEVADLVPALARAFVDQAERAIEMGLLQGYRETDESLTVLRGRLREQDQLRERFGIAIPLLVQFDEHSVDIAENRLLLGAALLLLKVPGVHRRTRARLRRLRHVLADVTPPVSGAPLVTWTPNRLNERYQVALWLAEVLLRRNAVDQVPGAVIVGGFLVDMAKVYEDFLTAALTSSLRRHTGWSRSQDVHQLDVAGEIVMRPDLVWYLDGIPAAVVDAKYKVEKPAGFPHADIYQMLAYCTALRLRNGHLVYAKGHADERTHAVRNADVTLHIHTLDLAALPAELLRQVDRLADRIAGSARAVLSTIEARGRPGVCGADRSRA